MVGHVKRLWWTNKSWLASGDGDEHMAENLSWAVHLGLMDAHMGILGGNCD